jgi:hypothetical protein
VRELLVTGSVRSFHPARRSRRLVSALVLCVLSWCATQEPRAIQAGAPGAVPDVLVQRVVAWAAATIETLASLVCEERYVQRLRQQRVPFGNRLSARGGVETTTRTLLSDYLLVHFPETRGWVPFRDVYDVDGRAVRDREDRLTRLLVVPHADRLAQAERIREESARFNLGPGTYDINVPTFALQFLLPDIAKRFRFKDVGTARLDGEDTVVLEYREEAHPTIIRGAADEDVPSFGRVWVVAADGRVVQTRLETRSGGKTTRIDVRYARDARLEASVPVEMIEHHAVGGDSLECKASYANYRRFAVNTVEQVR